ncbi:ankyrin repeat domain-containing protein 49-like [Montipora foliosa]|uniref:ankyrin repeat domain-containing protein 49-like n=1 Tax=Montipora foliosa TaxID=591990 RepID=UPI0035F1B23F
MSDVDSSDEERKAFAETPANNPEPNIVDFLPASIPHEDEQDTDARCNLSKIREEDLDQELSPSPNILLESCEKGMVDRVVEILELKASLINCKDEDGYSPLHRACYNGHLDVVGVLLERGADVRAVTEDGWQPLHCACRWGKTAVASLLLQNGADINAQTNGKQTALHFAASGVGGTTTLQLLLCNRWLDASVRNMQNETAYDIAYRSGKHYKLFEIVEDCINVK